MKLETECPKCKNDVLKESPSIDVNSQFTCAACGHSTELGNFLTAGSRDQIMKAAQQAAVKALSDIAGFKKP